MLRYMHLLAERVTLLRTCPTRRGHDARGECAKLHARRFARLVGVCTARPVPCIWCFLLRHSVLPLRMPLFLSKQAYTGPPTVVLGPRHVGLSRHTRMPIHSRFQVSL